MSSTHKAEVFRVSNVRNHPNADKLDLIEFAGFQTVVERGRWKDGDLAVFCQPDSVVDVRRPEFSFLADRAKADMTYRIKAIKLRGEKSFGVIVPAPPNSTEGDDVAELLGITHYDPPLPGEEGRSGVYLGGEDMPGPNIVSPKYDLEPFRRYGKTYFTTGEPVFITEKIDGANARYLFFDGRVWCGSRNNWKKEFPSYDHITVEGLVEKGVPEDRAKELVERLKSKPVTRNIWWEVLRNSPTLEKFLISNPNWVVYGEVFGNLGTKYGIPTNRFAGFDILTPEGWMPSVEAYDRLEDAGVEHAPILHGNFPFDFDAVCEMAEGYTVIPGAKKVVREGCVISPLTERRDPRLGRIKMKSVGVGYLSQK